MGITCSASYSSGIGNLIWSGDLDKRKLVTISWDTICLPGLRKLIALNKAALLKFTWNPFQRDTPWCRFFHGRFHFHVFSITDKYVCSSWYDTVTVIVAVLLEIFLPGMTNG